MNFAKHVIKFPQRLVRRTAALSKKPLNYNIAIAPQGRPRVLICGIYVGDKANSVEHLVEAFGSASHVEVEQRWACMRGTPPSMPVAAVTYARYADYHPKWLVLEEFVGRSPWERYDYVLFCDDDIYVGPGFLDRFIALQQHYDFALAQPARSLRSYNAWPIVRRRRNSIARHSGYVESGPLVSMDTRFLPLALPFDRESPMGWGYDHVWPLLADRAGLRLGIIDATPVDHTLRQQFALYNRSVEFKRMLAYLDTREHYQRDRLNRTLRRFTSLDQAPARQSSGRDGKTPVAGLVTETLSPAARSALVLQCQPLG